MKGAKSKSGSKKADKLSVSKKGAAAPKSSRKAKGKAAKDPNKPKRAPSAFFVFMDEFRKKFNRENPTNKSVAVVGKAGGDEWKSMSEAEKKPYVQKAEKLKAEYESKIKEYNMKQSTGAQSADDGESDKSKSEVNDEDEEGSGGEEE